MSAFGDQTLVADDASTYIGPFPSTDLNGYDGYSEPRGKPLRRRDFIKVAASAAVSWPLAIHAQQRVPRIGVIMNQSPGDGETQARSKAFLQELQKLGWS